MAAPISRRPGRDMARRCRLLLVRGRESEPRASSSGTSAAGGPFHSHTLRRASARSRRTSLRSRRCAHLRSSSFVVMGSKFSPGESLNATQRSRATQGRDRLAEAGRADGRVRQRRAASLDAAPAGLRPLQRAQTRVGSRAPQPAVARRSRGTAARVGRERSMTPLFFSPSPGHVICPRGRNFRAVSHRAGTRA
jgi:hypothetical protein